MNMKVEVPKNLTWKDVLQMGPQAEWMGHISKFFEMVVVPSGYRWFVWNDLIYYVMQQRPLPPTYVCSEVPAEALDRRAMRAGQRLGALISNHRTAVAALLSVAGGVWLGVTLAVWTEIYIVDWRWWAMLLPTWVVYCLSSMVVGGAGGK